jgi:hypothetical protein
MCLKIDFINKTVQVKSTILESDGGLSQKEWLVKKLFAFNGGCQVIIKCLCQVDRGNVRDIMVSLEMQLHPASCEQTLPWVGTSPEHEGRLGAPIDIQSDV